MNNFYVYVYLDTSKPGEYIYNDISFNYEPFYVGKGKKYRYKLHLYNNSKYITNMFFSNKIKKIKRITGKNPMIIKYKCNMKEGASHLLEIELIKKIGRRNIKLGPLVNLTNGGEGVSGTKHSKKTRKILSIKNKKRFEDPNERLKISNGLKNSVEWRLSINKPEYKAKLQASKLDPNGKFQKTMKSKKFSNTMSSAMSGEKNHMFGKTGEKSPNYGKGKEVYQYSINGKLVKEWPNSNIASDKLKLNRGSIDKICKEELTRHHGGFIWSYKNKPCESFIKFSKIISKDDSYIIFDFNNIEIFKTTNIRDISSFLNINRKLIKMYINNKMRI